MIAIIDIDMGNVNSVQKALSVLGHDSKVTQNHGDILNASKVIFPGVGSFAEASRRITKSGLNDIVKEVALIKKIPFLGICLGMQLLGDIGTEGGETTPGLELIRAEVLHLRRHQIDMIVPHVGWNDVHFSSNDSVLYKKIKNDSCFYFVHSYEMVLKEEVKAAMTDYHLPIVASVEKDNIFGTQFHPEKSQRVGLQLLKNFCEL